VSTNSDDVIVSAAGRWFLWQWTASN